MKTLNAAADAFAHGSAGFARYFSSVILSEPRRVEGPSRPGIEATPTRSRRTLADALEIVPGVTEADLAGTGYHLRKTNAHTSAPPHAPQNVRLQSTEIAGQLKIRRTAVERAAFYEVEGTFDPVDGPWTLVPAFNSTRGMTLEGLTRGKGYFVRVRAVATGRNCGPWSDIANAMAV